MIYDKEIDRIEKRAEKAILLGEMKARKIHETLSAVHEQLMRDLGDAPLTLWREDALSAKELISYVEAVTNKSSPLPGITE